MLTPSDILDEVRQILADAHRGKGRSPTSLTAYQILDRHPRRDKLIAERGMPGQQSPTAQGYGAAQVVSDACQMLHSRDEVEITYTDSHGELFEVAGQAIRAGYAVTARYRLL
jgi:hypothetical protein